MTHFYVDIDPQQIPPLWPPKTIDVQVEAGVYDLKAVPIMSICLVTNKMIKVSPIFLFHSHIPSYYYFCKIDADRIVERRINQMVEALEMLKRLVEEWKTEPRLPEIDWSRMRALDFQDTLQSRNSLAQRLTDQVCLQCPDFATHVRCNLFFIVNDPDAI